MTFCYNLEKSPYIYEKWKNLIRVPIRFWNINKFDKYLRRESLTHRAKQYHVFLMFSKNSKLRGINIYLGTFFIFYKVNEKGFESPTFLRICFLNILSFTSSSLLYLVSYVFYPQRKTRKNVLNWISERNVGKDCAESF